MQTLLAQRGVMPRAFSHYAVVTPNPEDAAKFLSALFPGGNRPLNRSCVAVYNVYVTRIQIQGTELEIIEPFGESHFSQFLKNFGQGLHHLAFEVGDIEQCLCAFKASDVELLDEAPRRGSHGQVAFAKPKTFSPLCVEICQPADNST